ncbi:hypothetical protein BCR33DRAFT_766343 [Rhizoclosmatium globosum]|uniref:Uncharacterized protein n=1 Tax=Rhizoclosmatium globosum TaxID=329046 RepID=A0A1Y2C9B0_9FUNG|nr:hypothetical protein BCR33DRAFT_766343 [Rhizoclosmatium globosum]|eukprot:ORY43620.1 hypothetical protein BCR33DRAFT_766343 [Rhizoclosmatium globosum]
MSSGAGYVESLTSPAFLKPIAYGAAYVAAAICSPFMDLKKHPISRGAPYALSVKNEQGNVYGPRLFIYSEADKLIPIKDLRENIQLAKDEGLVVEEKVFTTSAHVKHAVDSRTNTGRLLRVS